MPVLARVRLVPACVLCRRACVRLCRRACVRLCLRFMRAYCACVRLCRRVCVRVSCLQWILFKIIHKLSVTLYLLLVLVRYFQKIFLFHQSREFSRNLRRNLFLRNWATKINSAKITFTRFSGQLQKLHCEIFLFWLRARKFHSAKYFFSGYARENFILRNISFLVIRKISFCEIFLFRLPAKISSREFYFLGPFTNCGISRPRKLSADICNVDKFLGQIRNKIWQKILLNSKK